MAIKRRIERLENKSPTTMDKVFMISQGSDESYEEARQRYCQEENLSEADLEAGFVIRMVHI
jgi:hypothetical protein